MSAFNDAFTILKMNFNLDNLLNSMLQKGQMEDASQLRQMRQFVMENENSADPAKRQAAEEMYEHLTRLMSHLGGNREQSGPEMPPVQGFNAPPPEGPRPVGEGGAIGEVQQPAQHPMMKAWLSLKKNVIGNQGGVEYKMPDPIASMSQREQVPEMQPKGFFGRMKPTGEMTTGSRPQGAVQQNAQNPMDGFGAGQDNNATAMGGMGVGAVPGAQVTRMPRPNPFPVDVADQHQMGGFQEQNPSFSGRGFEEGNTSDYGGPARTMSSQDRAWSGGRLTDYRPTSVIPGGTHGDQFAPNIDFNRLS